MEPFAGLARRNFFDSKNFARWNASQFRWRTVAVKARALAASQYSLVSTLGLSDRTRAASRQPTRYRRSD
jgi:hypothetical protein